MVAAVFALKHVTEASMFASEEQLQTTELFSPSLALATVANSITSPARTSARITFGY